MLRKLGMLWKPFNVPFKCTHNAWFVFHVSTFDGNGLCVSGLMDKEFVFLGLDGRRHPNDKRSNQIVDWEGVDMIGGELARLVMTVDDDYDYGGYKDDDEMMMVMISIK